TGLHLPLVNGQTGRANNCGCPTSALVGSLIITAAGFFSIPDVIGALRWQADGGTCLGPRRASRGFTVAAISAGFRYCPNEFTTVGGIGGPRAWSQNSNITTS